MVHSIESANRKSGHVELGPVHFALDMILNINSNALYLLVSGANIHTAVHFLHGFQPVNNLPIQLNGAIFSLCTILKFVVASAVEAEVGALFVNYKEVNIIRLILHQLNHPQPATSIKCDNSTVIGIVNGTIKKLTNYGSF